MQENNLDGIHDLTAKYFIIARSPTQPMLCNIMAMNDADEPLYVEAVDLKFEEALNYIENFQLLLK